MEGSQGAASPHASGVDTVTRWPSPDTAPAGMVISDFRPQNSEKAMSGAFVIAACVDKDRAAKEIQRETSRALGGFLNNKTMKINELSM